MDLRVLLRVSTKNLNPQVRWSQKSKNFLIQKNYLNDSFVVAIKLHPDMMMSFLKETEKIEVIIKMEHITGEYCFFLHMFLNSTEEITLIPDRLSKLGSTTTYSVLSVPVDYKPIIFSNLTSGKEMI